MKTVPKTRRVHNVDSIDALQVRARDQSVKIQDLWTML